MKRRSLTFAIAATVALGLSACGSNGGDPQTPGADSPTTGAPTGATTSSESPATTAGGPIVVGSADFSESILLGEIYAGALKAAGVNASTHPNIGSREIYLKALEDNSVQVVPEYTGALAKFYDNSYAGTDPDEVYDKAKSLIPDDFELLEKSAAEDKDSLVVTKETAEKYNLKTVDDLAAVAKDFMVAAPPEFKERAQGMPGLEKTYGITFKGLRPLKGQAVVQALKNGQAEVANIFSTDPSIAINGFVTLEDTKKHFGSQNVVPLVRADVADQVRETLNKVSGLLTTEKLTDMLKLTDIDKQDPATVAQKFLADNGLGG